MSARSDKDCTCHGNLFGQNHSTHVLVEWFDCFDELQAGMTCSMGLHHIQQQELHTVLDNAIKVTILV